MDYQNAIKFIDEIIELRQHPPWIFPLDSEKDLISVKGLLWRGGKYEKMWHKFDTQYSHLQLFPHGSTMGPNTVALAMDKLFTEFFGTRPETRKEKINAIMTKMRDLGVAKNDIITMLVELRDGILEENV